MLSVPSKIARTFFGSKKSDRNRELTESRYTNSLLRERENREYTWPKLCGGVNLRRHVLRHRVSYDWKNRGSQHSSTISGLSHTLSSALLSLVIITDFTPKCVYPRSLRRLTSRRKCGPFRERSNISPSYQPRALQAPRAPLS